MAVRVDLNISLDGFATTTDQTRENPFGPDWARLVEAYTATRTFRARVLHETSGDGTTGVDDQYAEAYFAEVGAEIMGAGMFGLPRRRGRPGLARLVGRRASVPRPGVRAHPQTAPGARDGGRHDVPLPRRDTPRGARPRVRGRGRQGRADRRRRHRGARVPQGRTRRPAARRHRPDPARPRGPALGRPPRVRGRLQRDIGGRLERDNAPDLLALKTSWRLRAQSRRRSGRT